MGLQGGELDGINDIKNQIKGDIEVALIISAVELIGRFIQTKDLEDAKQQASIILRQRIVDLIAKTIRSPIKKHEMGEYVEMLRESRQNPQLLIDNCLQGNCSYFV